MASWIWVNIGSGNGFLPDGNKPLPEPMLTLQDPGGLHVGRMNFAIRGDIETCCVIIYCNISAAREFCAMA